MFKKKKFLKKQDFEEKIIFFKKHDFGEENIFKTQFVKKFCIQKITFWFFLPRKMLNFCVSRAFLKSPILKKKVFVKSMILKKKLFLKTTILEKKNIFIKHDF